VGTISVAQATEPGGVVQVTVTAAPGERYKFGAITIQGPETVPPGLPREALGLKTGDPIVAAVVTAAEANVSLRLTQQGYPFPEVGQRDVLLDPETTSATTRSRSSRAFARASAAFTTEGDLAFDARHVEILSRFKRGDLYDSRLVDDLREAMVATNLFTSVSAAPARTGEAAAEDTEFVTINVVQDAGPPRSLTASGGFSTGEGLRLEAGWEHRNLFPPEGAVRAAAVAGTNEQSINLSFRRSNAGKRDRTVLVEAEAGRRTYQAFRGYTARLAGLISRESTPIWQKVWTWSYGAELIATNERQFRVRNAPDPEATYFIGGLIGQLGHDRSDNLLNPTRGFRLLGRLNPEGVASERHQRVRARPDRRQRLSSGRRQPGACWPRSVRFDYFRHRPRRAGPVAPVLCRRGRLRARFGFQELGPKLEIANPEFDPDDPKEKAKPTILVPIGGRSLTEFSLRCRYRFGDYGVVAFLDAGQVTNQATPGFGDCATGPGSAAASTPISGRCGSTSRPRSAGAGVSRGSPSTSRSGRPSDGGRDRPRRTGSRRPRFAPLAPHRPQDRDRDCGPAGAGAAARRRPLLRDQYRARPALRHPPDQQSRIRLRPRYRHRPARRLGLRQAHHPRSDTQGPARHLLRAPRAELDWRPFSYFRNHVDIRELAIPQARLGRLPELKPSGDPNAPLLPDLDIDIGRLRVGRLLVDPPVTGRRHLLSLDGNAKIADGRAQVALNAGAIAAPGIAWRRPDGAEARRRPRDNRFDIEARVQGPGNGFVAGLAGLSQPVAAQVTGRGTWTNWQGRAQAMLAGQGLADLSVIGRNGTFEVTGRARPGLILPKGPAAELTAPLVQLNLTTTFAERRADLKLRAQSAALAVAAEGLLDLGQSRLTNMRVAARLLRPAAIAPNLNGREVRVAAVLNGPLRTPTVVYDVQAAALGFNETVVEGLRAQGRAVVGADRYTVPYLRPRAPHHRPARGSGRPAHQRRARRHAGHRRQPHPVRRPAHPLGPGKRDRDRRRRRREGRLPRRHPGPDQQLSRPGRGPARHRFGCRRGDPGQRLRAQRPRRRPHPPHRQRLRARFPGRQRDRHRQRQRQSGRTGHAS
jgi:translocation and assembly module TamA